MNSKYISLPPNFALQELQIPGKIRRFVYSWKRQKYWTKFNTLNKEKKRTSRNCYTWSYLGHVHWYQICSYSELTISMLRLSKICQVPNELFGARDVVGRRVHEWVALPYGELRAWNEDHGLVPDNALAGHEVGLTETHTEKDLRKPLVMFAHNPWTLPEEPRARSEYSPGFQQSSLLLCCCRYTHKEKEPSKSSVQAGQPTSPSRMIYLEVGEQLVKEAENPEDL